MRLKGKESQLTRFLQDTGETRQRQRVLVAGFDDSTLKKKAAEAYNEEMKNRNILSEISQNDLKNNAKYDIINISEKQFGKKIGKHAIDYGLDPSIEADRAIMLDTVIDIVKNYDDLAIGKWHQYENAKFYVKGNDVVIAKSDNTFVTILKGGVNNDWLKEARDGKS